MMENNFQGYVQYTLVDNFHSAVFDEYSHQVDRGYFSKMYAASPLVHFM